MHAFIQRSKTICLEFQLQKILIIIKIGLLLFSSKQKLPPSSGGTKYQYGNISFHFLLPRDYQSTGATHQYLPDNLTHQSRLRDTSWCKLQLYPYFKHFSLYYVDVDKLQSSYKTLRPLLDIKSQLVSDSVELTPVRKIL